MKNRGQKSEVSGQWSVVRDLLLGFELAHFDADQKFIISQVHAIDEPWPAFQKAQLENIHHQKPQQRPAGPDMGQFCPFSSQLNRMALIVDR
jgi:hypothetical protein